MKKSRQPHEMIDVSCMLRNQLIVKEIDLRSFIYLTFSFHTSSMDNECFYNNLANLYFHVTILF